MLVTIVMLIIVALILNRLGWIFDHVIMPIVVGIPLGIVSWGIIGLVHGTILSLAMLGWCIILGILSVFILGLVVT